MRNFATVLSYRPVAEGRTAQIYTLDKQHVLKLYRDWCPLDWVDYEARIARTIYEAGIPSPEPGEIVEVNKRRGLIYERLEGISMAQDIRARPWRLWKHARTLAELQFMIHEKFTTGLPTYKDRLRDDIDGTSYLTKELRKNILSRLEQLPDSKTICHGDYHPENILITKRGPVVIDWMTACTGSPWADVARTSLILTIGVKAAGKRIPPILRMLVGLYHRIYLPGYRSLRRDQENEMCRWMPLLAAARLNENISQEREALITIVKQEFAH